MRLPFTERDTSSLKTTAQTDRRLERLASIQKQEEAEGRRAFWCRRRALTAEVALGHVDFAAVAAAGRLVGPAGAGDEE